MIDPTKSIIIKNVFSLNDIDNGDPSKEHLNVFISYDNYVYHVV